MADAKLTKLKTKTVAKKYKMLNEFVKGAKCASISRKYETP